MIHIPPKRPNKPNKNSPPRTSFRSNSASGRVASSANPCSFNESLAKVFKRKTSAHAAHSQNRVQAPKKTQISFPQRTSEGIDVEKTISNPLQNQLASQFHWPFGNCHLSFRHFLPSHCPRLFGTDVRPLSMETTKTKT